MTTGSRTARARRLQAVAAGDFKQRCLQLMDEVAHRHTSFLITKRGAPVAKLVPVDDATTDPFGSMRGTVTYRGDVVAPDLEDWLDESA